MVCNVPDFGVEEVAMHAVALALALTRRLHQASADTRAGMWDLNRLRPMHSPAVMVAGVVGLGRIGRITARIGRTWFSNSRVRSLRARRCIGRPADSCTRHAC